MSRNLRNSKAVHKKLIAVLEKNLYIVLRENALAFQQCKRDIPRYKADNFLQTFVL